MAWLAIARTDITKTREDGNSRTIRVEVLQDVASQPPVLDLPVMDGEGSIVIKQGNSSDELNKPIPITQVTVKLKADTASYPILDQLRTAKEKQFYLVVTDTTNSYELFSGYYIPDRPRWQYLEDVQEIAMKAVDGFAYLAGVTQELQASKTVDDVLGDVNTALGRTRDAEYISTFRPSGYGNDFEIPTGLRYPAGSFVVNSVNFAGVAKEGEHLSLLDELKGLAKLNGQRVFLCNGKICFADLHLQATNPGNALTWTGRDGNYSSSFESNLVTSDASRVLRGGEFGQQQFVERFAHQLRYTYRSPADVRTQDDGGAAGGLNPTVNFSGDEMVRSGDIINFTEGLRFVIDMNWSASGLGSIGFEKYATVKLFRVWLDAEIGNDLYWDNEQGKWVESQETYFTYDIYGNSSQTADEIATFAGFTTTPIPDGHYGSIKYELYHGRYVSDPDEPSALIEIDCENLTAQIEFGEDFGFQRWEVTPATESEGRTLAQAVTVDDADDFSSVGIQVFADSSWENTDSWNDADGAGRHGEIVARRLARMIVGQKTEYVIERRDLQYVSLADAFQIDDPGGGASFPIIPLQITHDVLAGFYEITGVSVPDDVGTEASSFAFTILESNNGGASGGADQTAEAAGTTTPLINQEFLARMGGAAYNQLQAGALAKTSEQISGTRTTIPIDEINDVRFFETQKLQLIHPITFNRAELVVGETNEPGATSITLEEEIPLPRTFPAGSFIIASSVGISQSLIAANGTFQYLTETQAAGLTTTDLDSNVDGEYSSVPAVLYDTVSEGDSFKLVASDTQKEHNIHVVNDTPGEGEYTLEINPPVHIVAPAGSPLFGDEVQKRSELKVSPAGLLLQHDREKTGDSIGTIATTIPPGATEITSIELTNIDTDTRVRNNEPLLISNHFGQYEYIYPTGNQYLNAVSSPATETVTISAHDFQHSYRRLASWVKDPNRNVSTRLYLAENTASLAASRSDDNVDAIAALDLRVDDNETAYASLSAQVNALDDDVDDYASATLVLEADMDNLSAKAALIVDSNGVVGSIDLTADGTTGFSNITIKGTNLLLDGDTTVTGDLELKGKLVGDLVINASGSIRNSNYDFEIDDDGINLAYSTSPGSGAKLKWGPVGEIFCYNNGGDSTLVLGDVDLILLDESTYIDGSLQITSTLTAGSTELFSLQVQNGAGFNGTSPIGKQTVTSTLGTTAGNAAGINEIGNVLQNLGLINNNFA